MTRSNIGDWFVRDHEALEKDLLALGNAAEGALAPELIRVYRRFEAGLRAHLRVEEQALFPLIADEATRAALEGEHRAILRQVDELGLLTELHSVRLAQIQELIGQLRDHAAREARILYPLAIRLPSEGQAAVRARLERALP